MNDSMKGFLNAKTSVTLGASAAMVLAFTTTLCSAFALPAAPVALGLSCLFALVQLAYSDDKIVTRILFWPICTLVIFHAARGGNTSLSEMVPNATPPASITVPVSGGPGVGLFVQSAWAEPTNAVQDRYYLWKVEHGKAVYTNTVGNAVTNDAPKKVFESWKWSESK